MVASTFFYSVVCWGDSIRKRDTNRLDRLIRRAGSVVGMKLESVVAVAERRTLDKLLAIINEVGHPLLVAHSMFCHSVLIGVLTNSCPLSFCLPLPIAPIPWFPGTNPYLTLHSLDIPVSHISTPACPPSLSSDPYRHSQYPLLHYGLPLS